MGMWESFRKWRRGGAPEKLLGYSPAVEQVSYEHAVNAGKTHVSKPLMDTEREYSVGDIVPVRETDAGIAYYKVTRVRPGEYPMYNLHFHRLVKDIMFCVDGVPRKLIEVKRVDIQDPHLMLEQVGLDPFVLEAPEWVPSEAITESDVILHEGEELDENFCDTGGHFDMEAAMEYAEWQHDSMTDR